ncbi:hypothetical protein D3C84_760350 [compost metagenome]
MRQRLPQLRLPIARQSRTVQLVDALVVGWVHAQPQYQFQALGLGQFEAVGEPTLGAAEVRVAIGGPLHDHGVSPLFDGVLPDPLPLRLAQVGIGVDRLIENPLVRASHRGAQQQTHSQ